ncbi:MAG: hypothetical protein AAF639_41120, partial [Chloroflexota bacterium]
MSGLEPDISNDEMKWGIPRTVNESTKNTAKETSIQQGTPKEVSAQSDLNPSERVRLQTDIEQMNINAWSLRYHDVTEAQRLSMQTYELAKANEDTHGQALGLRTLSYCFAANSAYDEALTYALQSFSLLEEIEDQKNLAEVAKILGHIH